MDRRRFLALSTMTLAAFPLRAFAFPGTEYAPGNAEAAIKAGDVVFLDFKASWCSTCAAQERVLKALSAENPMYAQKIKFFTVDWDAHGAGDLSRSLNIPRRSTLVALKGTKEIGRIVAGTSKSDIKALLDQALAAASA